jgi:diguanylate cyclase (GGDEF)-like protein
MIMKSSQIIACLQAGSSGGNRSQTGSNWRQALQRAEDGLLSTEPQQRAYIIRFLIGALNCLAALIALELALYLGMTFQDTIVHTVTIAGIAVELLFYGMLRSGLNKRFADPSQTEYQIDAAIVFIGIGYWLVAPFGRAIPLVLLVVVLMFGMFCTTPKQLGRCCLWAMGVMSLAFAMAASDQPDEVTTTQQWFHAVMLALVLPTVYVLGSQLSLIRNRLRERKNELAFALQRIEALATTDMLTGLLNRRQMHHVLDHQEEVAIRQNQDFCICMLDIDHFKRFNDLYGHNVGDEVLRVFASTAQQALRETDVICRWGGEEFLVMMRSDALQAGTAIQRLRLDLMDACFPSSDGSPLTVTFSAGLTTYRRGESISSMIERADRALYQAKAQGRNQTVTHLGKCGSDEHRTHAQS